MIYHFMTIEDIDIHYVYGGAAVILLEDVDKLTPEKIQKLGEMKEKIQTLGNVLDVFGHLNYQHSEQFMHLSDYILIAASKHNDKRARSAAIQILKEQGIDLNDFARLIKDSEIEGESE